jgi:hypothetical protein
MSFLGGLFQSFGRLLPGYMQGERQAIQDNWNDLNQYNKVQAGQLQNMFDENVMPDRMQMAKDNAIINNFQRHAAGLDLGYKYAQMPLAYWQLGQQTAWAPVMGQMRHQMLMQNPALMGLGGGRQNGGLLQQAALGGLGGGWQYGLGGGYGGYGLGGMGYGRMPSRY